MDISASETISPLTDLGRGFFKPDFILGGGVYDDVIWSRHEDVVRQDKVADERLCSTRVMWRGHLLAVYFG